MRSPTPSTSPTPAQRHAAARARRANQLKQQLIEHLGGCCEECGCTTCLQINHIYGRTWTPRQLTHYRRVLRYWQEARHEPPLINLLCETHNAVYRPLPMPGAGQHAVQQPF